MSEWIKGKPEKGGLYWFAKYDGHGEYIPVLGRVFYSYPQEVFDSPEYPKPNCNGGYRGEALKALNDFEEKNPRVLCYYFLNTGGGPSGDKEYYVLSEASEWQIAAYIRIERPDMPNWL